MAGEGEMRGSSPEFIYMPHISHRLFQWITKFFHWHATEEQKRKATSTKVKNIHVPTSMRQMTERTPLDFFRDDHLEAIRDRAQDFMDNQPPPESLTDIPDSLSKDETTRRRRQLAQWRMENFNRAARE